MENVLIILLTSKPQVAIPRITVSYSSQWRLLTNETERILASRKLAKVVTYTSNPSTALPFSKPQNQEFQES
jgi:hypothetical protein